MFIAFMLIKINQTHLEILMIIYIITYALKLYHKWTTIKAEVNTLIDTVFSTVK